jgi:shikimate dehydrogenase
MTRRQFAVFGNPIGHSRSPEIHHAFADALGHDISYVRIEASLDPGGFAAAIAAFRHAGGAGCNVTVPFKREAFHLATEVSPEARCGAANTLTFADNVDGGIRADNTDGIGLVRDVRDNLGIRIRGQRVLIVGAGGAARSVVGALATEEPQRLALVNRSIDRAHQLATDLRGATGADVVEVIDLARLPAHRFDIIINATSASLSESLPLVPFSCFGSGAFAYDMMYGKGLTPFLALARNAGAQVADGVGMLVEQAAEAYRIWHGVKPITAPIIAKLAKPL